MTVKELRDMLYDLPDEFEDLEVEDGASNEIKDVVYSAKTNKVYLTDEE